jgi:hypothetical protein
MLTSPKKDPSAKKPRRSPLTVTSTSPWITWRWAKRVIRRELVRESESEGGGGGEGDHHVHLAADGALLLDDLPLQARKRPHLPATRVSSYCREAATSDSSHCREAATSVSSCCHDIINSHWREAVASVNSHCRGKRQTALRSPHRLADRGDDLRGEAAEERHARLYEGGAIVTPRPILVHMKNPSSDGYDSAEWQRRPRPCSRGSGSRAARRSRSSSPAACCEIRAGFTLYMVTIIEIYSVKPVLRNPHAADVSTASLLCVWTYLVPDHIF